MGSRIKSPTITASGKTMGRPRLKPPPGAAKLIEKLVAEGRGVVGVARALNANAQTVREWLAEQPELQRAYEFGREAERQHLHSLLRAKAEKGNIIAALFLLKSRHGYTEGTEGGASAKVNITLSLPGAMKPSDYVVQVNDRRTEDQPVAIPESWPFLKSSTLPYWAGAVARSPTVSRYSRSPLTQYQSKARVLYCGDARRHCGL